MTDESQLARALRIAMQNHTSVYGGRNALDQGDYGYGTPVTYSTPNALSSSGLQHQGPWMRDYMPNTLADLLSQILTYAPMAVPAMRGRVMENGLRPQDYAIAPAKERATANGKTSYQDEFQDVLSLPHNYAPKSQLHSSEITQYSGFRAPSDYRATPMEMRAMQGTKANSNAAPEYTLGERGLPFTREEMERLGMKFEIDPRYRQEPFDWGAGKNSKPFDVIPGGKE